MSQPATMRVMPTDPATQGPWVVINAADFDPTVHQPYSDDESPRAAAPQEPEPTQRRRGRSANT